MVVAGTLNLLESSLSDKLDDLISDTSESVNFLVCLPLVSLSKLFSWTVPLTKCAGLTQQGLSQVCMTIGLLLSKPLCMSWEYLCARHCLPSNWNKPYPSESNPAVHNQQEFVLLTLEKNRVIGSDLSLAISKLYMKNIKGQDK